MLKSMTGYGKGEGSSEVGRVTAEIRSVNHRYAEVGVKLPRGFLAHEQEVRRLVQERLRRGKVDVLIQFEQSNSATVEPAINLPLARGYLEALTRLRHEFALSGEVTLEFLASQRDVLVSAESQLDVAAVRAPLTAAVGAALDQLETMRQQEGKALDADLCQRRQTLAALLDRIRQRAPQMVIDGASRLKERLTQLLADVAIDPTRLAQEVALLADRSDITEELVRFDSHLGQLDLILAADESVGRKLDFLLQEMNREVNTIGSKANDLTITSVVVELKGELEKIREQVQNIE
jgi:uncharacterized protein (TIGR00255 family)